MSKSFLIGLFCALLLLGGLFFAMGYLSAYSLTEHSKQPTTCQSASSWETASQNHLASQKNKPAIALPQSLKGGGVVGGLVAGIAGGIALNKGTATVNRIQSRYDRTGMVDPIQNVPPGLRPFALQAYRQQGHGLNQELRRGPELLRAPLRPQYFGRVPAPQERGQHYRNNGYYGPQRPPFSPNVRRVYRAQPSQVQAYGYRPPVPVYVPAYIPYGAFPLMPEKNMQQQHVTSVPFPHQQQRLVGMG